MEKVLMENVGKEIKKFRIQRGITQRKLASKAGVSRSTVERLENVLGHNPKLSTVMAIKRATRLTFDKLINGRNAARQ